MDSSPAPDDLLTKTVAAGGAMTTLVFFVTAFIKEWIVPGTTHREALRQLRDDKDKEIAHEREENRLLREESNKWESKFEAALRGVTLARQTVEKSVDVFRESLAQEASK